MGGAISIHHGKHNLAHGPGPAEKGGYSRSVDAVVAPTDFVLTLVLMGGVNSIQLYKLLYSQAKLDIFRSV